VEVFYLVAEGVEPPVELGERIIFTPQPDGYFRVLDKTVAGIHQVLERFNPDFIIRGNSSNYYQVPQIRGFLLETVDPNQHFYGGKETFVNDEMTPLEAPVLYAGGTGIYLSRSTANLLLKIPVSEYFGVVDDVAIGDWLSSQGLSLTRLARNDVTDFEPLQVALQTRVKSWEDNRRTVQRFFEVDALLGKQRRFSRLMSNLGFFLRELIFLVSKKRVDASLRLIMKFRPIN
jgi:hypothetical protein